VNHDAEVLTVIFIFVGTIVSIGCFTGIITTWIKYRAKRVVSADLTSRLAEISDRMAKLDNAVDAMAVEVGADPFVQRLTNNPAAVQEPIDGESAVVGQGEAVKVALPESG